MTAFSVTTWLSDSWVNRAADYLSWLGAEILLVTILYSVWNTASAFASYPSYSEAPLVFGILLALSVWTLSALFAIPVLMFLVPAHERCHQAVARLFGVDGRIECVSGWLPRMYNRGRFFTRPAHKIGELEVWQDRLVSGAPVVIGIAMLPFAWALVHVIFDVAFVWGAVSGGIVSVSLSVSDWKGVLRFPWERHTVIETELPASHLAAEGIPR